MFSRGINEYCVQNLRNLPAHSSGAVFRSLRLALPRSTKHCDSGENGVSLIGRFPLYTENEPKVVITDDLKSRLEYVHYVCSSPGARVPTFDNLYDCCKGGRSTNLALFLQRHVQLRTQPFRHLGSKIKDSKGLRTPVPFAYRRTTGNTTYIGTKLCTQSLRPGSPNSVSPGLDFLHANCFVYALSGQLSS